MQGKNVYFSPSSQKNSFVRLFFEYIMQKKKSWTPVFLAFFLCVFYFLRLIVLWRFLYKRVVCYWIQLNKKAHKNIEEENVVSLLLSHIQATIQSSGMILEQHFKINSIAG